MFFVLARDFFHFRTKTKKFSNHVFSTDVLCIFGLRTAIRRESYRMMGAEYMRSDHGASCST
ncbi:DUF1661 domain-containing protein [Porphyromonas gulae]|uniref:DUF1661 domain-containing protein n=1 Tax=Porphyromonas gulae TaxID=111105 RepID=UPI00126A1042|nr:DUF1661 domain-containing protein [Porphyromonas gulae]